MARGAREPHPRARTATRWAAHALPSLRSLGTRPLWHHAEYRAGTVHEVAPCHAAQVCNRGPTKRLDAAERVCGLAEDHLEEPNLLSLPRRGFQWLERTELEPSLGASQLIVSHHVGSHAGKCFV